MTNILVLLHYNAVRNVSEVLLSGVSFANGIAISPDEDFVVVAETPYERLRKVYVKGPKKGQKDMFIEGLPGCPDNVQTIPDGSGILVSLILAEGENDIIIFKIVAAMPLVRKFVTSAITFVDDAFKYLNNSFPNVVFERVVNLVGSFQSFGIFFTDSTGFAKVDWNGNIVDLWICSDKSIMSMTDAIVFGDKLYLGSLTNNYLGVVNAPPNLISSYKQKQNGKPAKPSESKVRAKKIK